MTLTTRIRERILARLVRWHCDHLDATEYRKAAPWGVR